MQPGRWRDLMLAELSGIVGPTLLVTQKISRPSAPIRQRSTFQNSRRINATLRWAALNCMFLPGRAGWLGDALACFQSVIILLCKALNLAPPQLASPQLTTLPVTSFTSSAFVSLLPTITKAIFMLYHQILAWPGPQEINEKFNLLLFSLASTIVLFVIINSARMTPPWGLPLTF